MMGDDDRDAGDVAEHIADALNRAVNSDKMLIGWEFSGLDIGELNITTPSGQRFRFGGFELIGNEE